MKGTKRKYGENLYSAKMIQKYGNINLGHMTNKQLERFAKDVQREANRRYDIAMRHSHLRTTKAFREFEKSGGGVSLSHREMFLGISRRKYLGNEIRRAMRYLNAQTSSYTGYKKWFQAQRAGALKAYKAAGGNNVKYFDDLISDPARAAKFWKLVRDFQEMNAGVYYKRGSPDVVEATAQVWKILDNQDLSMGEAVEALDEYLTQKDAGDDPDLQEIVDEMIAEKMAEGVTIK